MRKIAYILGSTLVAAGLFVSSQAHAFVSELDVYTSVPVISPEELQEVLSSPVYDEIAVIDGFDIDDTFDDADDGLSVAYVMGADGLFYAVPMVRTY